MQLEVEDFLIELPRPLDVGCRDFKPIESVLQFPHGSNLSYLVTQCLVLLFVVLYLYLLR
jgi:hypothetical protein